MMNMLVRTKLKKVLEDNRVQDFPIPGVNFIDIQPLFQDPILLGKVIDALCDKVWHLDFDLILCLDARGFLFAPQVAMKLGKPMLMVRKQGKLPPPVVEFPATKEYGSDILCFSERVKNYKRVLIIDDVIATGGTVTAVTKAVESLGLEVEGVLALIDIPGLQSNFIMRKHTLISF